MMFKQDLLFLPCQLSHLGTTVLHMDTSTHQTTLVHLKLEECNGTISWSSPKSPSITFQKTKEISPGLKLKYATICRENITYLDEGFIDLTTLKTVELSSVDMITVPKQTLAEISSCFKVSDGTDGIISQFCGDDSVKSPCAGGSHPVDTDVRVFPARQQAGGVCLSCRSGDGLG